MSSFFDRLRASVQADSPGPIEERDPGTLIASEAGRNLPVFLYAAAVGLIHVAFNLGLLLPDLWVGVFHFASLGLLALMLHPVGRTAGWGEALLGLFLLLAAVGLLALEGPLYERGLQFSLADWLVCLLIVMLAIELVRRTAGWLIPLLVVVLLAYASGWGANLPGVFGFPGLRTETVLYRAVYTSEGLFGTIARISWSYVFMFVLLGAFLVRSGAGDFIIALARAVAGRVAGGPGLVAVASSGLMGSITGSAVANTASTGVITIPLMKRAGFPARFAGGVEAAASTGGQLMPPVMGAGAFLMANFTGLSYLDIIAAALIPALLYFLSLALFVRVRAGKLGLEPQDAGEGETIARALRRGWPLLLPLAVLVGMLVAGFTPVYAAACAMLATVAGSWLSGRRMGLVAVIEALSNGTRAMVPTAMLLIAIGLVVNVLTTTGIGNTLSIMIAQWAGSSLLIALVLVALASLILGMGLPVTAAYIVLAAVSAPTLFGLMLQAELVQALVEGQITPLAREALLLAAPAVDGLLGQPMPPDQAQVLVAAMTPELQRTTAEALLDPAVLAGSLLAAHMIIFWLSQDSNVTPPVALAAFTAAGIAGTRPMATGFTAWKLAKGLYLIPLLFAYTPLVSGDWSQALQVAVFALFGLYALVGLLEGWLEGPLAWPVRLSLIIPAGLLMWPDLDLFLRLLGLLALSVPVAFGILRRA
ncbi:MAG: TRAP transporter fused permease subunit [Wenzhouxiangella sp.]|nr:MAG: TRAP transporter fused permease subunit [Wenzhouxiangella sp.]